MNSTATSTAAQPTVAPGATLTVAGAAPAVTMSGSGATFSNAGTLAQTGTGHAILVDSGTGLVITNGSSTNTAALIQATLAETIQAKKAVSAIAIHNYGIVESLNAANDARQAIELGKVSGANLVHNYAGGEIRATDADAVRPGRQGVVINAGKIVTRKRATTKGIGAIDGAFNTGIDVTNARGGLIDGGRHGITGGSDEDAGPFTMRVTNEAGATIRGNDGAGLNFDGLGAGQVITIVNHGTIEGTGVTGDGDGVDVDGLVDITNTGIIRSNNASDQDIAYSEAISVGGGTIVNAGIIEGLAGAGNGNVVGRAIALVGNDIDHSKEREGIYADTRVENRPGGMIRGANESAIVAHGRPNDFTIAIDNQAGATILGGGAVAAILITSNRTTITNAGTIDGAASNQAITLGRANNTLIVSGGSAVIQGAIEGGAGAGNTMVVDAGAGNQFAYAGAIAHFATLNVKSGHARLSGQLSFINQTVVSGGTLTLSGAPPATPGGALVLAGGTLDLAGTGDAGRSFASLALEDDSGVEAGAAVLSVERVGMVAAGKTLTLGGALRIAGDVREDAAFLDLVRAIHCGDADVTVSFDGRHTSVSPARAPADVHLSAGDGPAPP